MKKKAEFLRELDEITNDKIAFIHYFLNDEFLQEKLYSQYLKTELQPNLNLYIDRYFTAEEIKQGFVEVNENIPKSTFNNTASFTFIETDFEKELKRIQLEFYKKVKDEPLNEKYCSHQVKSTQIFKDLDFVFQEIKDFKNQFLDEEIYNSKQYSECVVISIINRLENLKIPVLKKIILEDFKIDQENVYIDIEYYIKDRKDTSIDDAKRKYRELKRYADNYIKEYLDKGFPRKKKNKKNDYSQKQVAIAYFFLGIPIIGNNYVSILKKHTQTTSIKILQKRISSTNELTKMIKSKTADTKHLNTLMEAKRLISGKKNTEAENSIDQVISTFKKKYNDYYQ